MSKKKILSIFGKWVKIIKIVLIVFLANRQSEYSNNIVKPIR